MWAFLQDQFNQLMAAFAGFFNWFFGWMGAFWGTVTRYFPAGTIYAILIILLAVVLILRMGLKEKK